ncbi:MAG TPA: Wzz/FepE/Etk N-terminal domain-containing protein [Micromonosporaceae bacterium]|nr:Wzz/FepE/Etk N-terminal domain-containing protein [Micromonosporaceae bacterium]
MDATRPAATDMSYYFGLLRRYWWIIMLTTVVGAAASYAFADSRPREYRSTTTILVAPTTVVANASGGRTNGEINLDTEAQLVTSSDVAGAAAKLLKSTTALNLLTRAVSVSVPANTTVLAITYTATSARVAQAGSHAFATAYLSNRLDNARADLSSQEGALSAKIKEQTGELTKINDALAPLSPSSAKYANLQSQRQTLTSQITALTNKLNTLTTTTVTPGKIITDASLPNRPASPSVPLFLASGALLGALAGLGMAAGRQRFDKRIRSAADLSRYSGLSLLAQLPRRVKARLDDVYPPGGPGGRTFNRLRNEVVACLGDTEQVIMVTGASRGNASTLVAANLAAALARGGRDVVLVSARMPESLVETVPGPRMLGVAATPGLSDVIAGKVPLETATQRAPRNPWLSVITTGGTASAAGFLRSQTLREIFARLREQAEYVVVEAPSTATSSDAQSLASLADVTIVAVELRRTTRAELVDAAEQLDRVSTVMLGCVVLPPLGRQHAEPQEPVPARPLFAMARSGSHLAAAHFDNAPTRAIPARTAVLPAADADRTTGKGRRPAQPDQRGGRRPRAGRKRSSARAGRAGDGTALLDPVEPVEVPTAGGAVDERSSPGGEEVPEDGANRADEVGVGPDATTVHFDLPVAASDGKPG